MLHPDKARETLEKLHDEKWPQKKLGQAGKLPPKLRAIARLLLGRDTEGKEFKDWRQRTATQAKLPPLLDELRARDRLTLFQTFFPKLAPHIEGAWTLLHRLPYQQGYARKSFRAPADPAATRGRRCSWFQSLIGELEGYDPDLEWVASWAAHLGDAADVVGYLLAAAIDAGGAAAEQVLEILKESASNQHAIGGMGRHVTRALLVCSRPDAWEFMEKFLLAAQRQEGLRQAILETIDEAHPEAFRRMLRLIKDHDLARFSATVRAVNVWFGFQWDAVSVKVVNQAIEQALLFLDDDSARTAALAKGEPATAYLALWSLAFADAGRAADAAAGLLKHPKVERRFAAVTLLAQLRAPAARAPLLAALEDEDLRVVLTAFDALPGGNLYDEDEEEEEQETPVPDMFERIEQLLPRLPEKDTNLKPLVWPWTARAASRKRVAGRLVFELGKRPPTRLLPYLPQMDTWDRARVAEKLAAQKKWDAQARDTLFALVRDPASSVREAALQGLEKCKITAQEAEQLEGCLTRTAADLRRGVLQLLLSQDNAAASASVERLLASADPNQRLAGLELLRQLAVAGRAADAHRRRGEAYRAARPKVSEAESAALDALAKTGERQPTLDNALGLMDPAERSPAVAPVRRKVTFMTPAVTALLKALDDLVHEHREETISLKGDSEEEPTTELLGNIGWRFPSPDTDKPYRKQANEWPLRKFWESWWEERPKTQRDGDGLELLRAAAWLAIDDWDWDSEWKPFNKGPRKEAFDLLTGGQKRSTLRYEQVVERVARWLLLAHPPEGAVRFLLDAAETSLALVPAPTLAAIPDPEDDEDDWRNDGPWTHWLNQAKAHLRSHGAAWTNADRQRLWQLLHWLDELAPGWPRSRPDTIDLLAAYEHGFATDADLFDHLLGPRPEQRWGSSFGGLQDLTRHPPPALAAQLGVAAPRVRQDDDEDEDRSAWRAVPKRHAAVAALVDRCRERILDIELQRGELPAPATDAALAMQSLYGADTLLRLLAALGGKPPDRPRGYFSDNRGKRAVLTHLLSVTKPGPGDTVDSVAERLRPFTQREGPEWPAAVAFVAPQWAPHIERALDWAGFHEGITWFLAHAGNSHGDDWQRLIEERSALTEEERNEGAVDVDWFHRVYNGLGPKRWRVLDAVARHASSDNGYKKAQTLAQVLLGKAKKSVLVAGIRKKNLRESVRLLGLLPLASGAGRDKDLAGRYRVFQEYARYARSLGPMSRESAVRTAGIGLANLARTAGYPDPVRLEWAMEAKSIADLAAGPVARSVDGVTVSLSLDSQGQPELTVQRGEKPLKTIPPAVRKDRKVAELTERRAELKRQASRLRSSLEAAMCRGDTFSGTELKQLFTNPMLVPTLERLVLLGEGIAGYPIKGGQALRDHGGKVEPIKPAEQLRLAHPHDFLQAGDWHLWQADCFERERIQPFKQVFRELYVLTSQEKSDGSKSQRYAGQQVNPQQALALLAGRGWHTKEEVRRTFPEAGITAQVWFRSGAFTPLEVEGLTLDNIRFTRRGEGQPLPLTAVPPRIFSEVMRDLDLVVSVAHRGGVDPEASASTVQMRAALLRETATLLGLGNVRTKEPHVLIKGAFGNYSVHLGSGVVHKQPGGSLCIVPVHAQHRGRLFLPFADDDARTAEVLSKVLLLARDRDIQDPTILDQIRAAP